RGRRTLGQRAREDGPAAGRRDRYRIRCRPERQLPLENVGVEVESVVVRQEHESDRDSVFELNRLAFGQEDEGRLVDALRGTANWIPELSLVALADGQIAGHILFSVIVIDAGEKGEVPALALAPMAVRPELQNRGVGSELVRKGLDECRRLGHRIVIVVGHPNYYPRFGFTPARAKGLEAPFAVPDDAFLVLELVPDALAGIRGMVRYPPAFGAM